MTPMRSIVSLALLLGLTLPLSEASARTVLGARIAAISQPPDTPKPPRT